MKTQSPSPAGGLLLTVLVIIFFTATASQAFDNQILTDHLNLSTDRSVFESAAPATCVGDFDLDGDNDGSDLGEIVRSFGDTGCCVTDPRECLGDFQCDDIVDRIDLATFAGGFGKNNCTSCIQLTHISQYPNLAGENLQGTVTGVNPQDYDIVVYIRVEDVWWIKPSLDFPKTTIRSDGTWSCDITTGGNDAYATEIAVYLLHKNCLPGICLPCYSLPACPQFVASYRESIGPPQRVIEFGGYPWRVKRRDFPAGPGPNYFSDKAEQVWVDEEGLHLTIRKIFEKWYCSEVILDAAFGYGTYIVHTRGRVDIIDPSMVFGLFTWDGEAPHDSFRELDIEFARWNKSDDDTNSQYVVQPCSSCPGCGDHCSRFRLDLDDAQHALTHYIIWNPAAVEFRTYYGNHINSPPEADLAYRWTRTGDLVPTPGKETMRFNFWLNNGNAPVNGNGEHLTITHFSWQAQLPF